MLKIFLFKFFQSRLFQIKHQFNLYDKLCIVRENRAKGTQVLGKRNHVKNYIFEHKSLDKCNINK